MTQCVRISKLQSFADAAVELVAVDEEGGFLRK
jgi:hypothetical protein